MKVIFDNIIFSLQRAGGISVVWFELLSKVLQNKDMDLQFIEYDNSIRNIFRQRLTLNNNNIQWYDKRFLKVARYFDVKIKYNVPFIFHSSYYRICSNPKAINITTVHDFTYEYYFKGLKKVVHCWQKHRAIRKSDYIICISENTKSDLLKFIPNINENRIKVIYNGVSEEYFPISSKDFQKPLNPFKPYSFILFVGGRENYKNFELTVKAVSETEFNLIIVGAPLTEKEISFLNSYMDESRYCSRVRISNAELNNLYNQAYCLLYLSSYEGFGIPVLESQKAGCPVIAYNRSSISEIIGATPLLIETLTTDAITEKLELLGDNETRKKIVKDGIENANRFSWDTMSENVLKLYNNIINTYSSK